MNNPTGSRNIECSSPAICQFTYGFGNSKMVLSKNETSSPQWHPNTNKVVTCEKGEGIVTIVKFGIRKNQADSDKTALRSYAISEGDKLCIEKGDFHYFVNHADGEFALRLTFENPFFDTVSLGDVIKYYREI